MNNAWNFRRHKEIDLQVERDLEAERTAALRASLNKRGSSTKTSYSRVVEKKEDGDEEETSARDKYKIDRVLPPMRRKKYYY